MKTYQTLRKTVFGMIVASLLWSGAITVSAEEITDEQLIETLETPDTFTVKVPKTISANSAGNISTNIISNGTIQGYEKLQISIPDTITMSQSGKSSIKCNIISENTEIPFDVLKQTGKTNFSINTSKLTAGTWSGKIEISITKKYYPGLYSRDFSSYIPWDEFTKENGNYFGEKTKADTCGADSHLALTDTGKTNSTGILVYTDDVNWNTALYMNENNLSAVVYPENFGKINDIYCYGSSIIYVDMGGATDLDNTEHYGAFYDLSNCKKVHMENSYIEEIPTNEFYNIGNAEILLPQNLKKIGTHSFSHSSITKLDIPDTVWKIGYCAFDYSKLSHFIAPKNLKVIGYGAFYICDLEIVDMSKCTKLVNPIIEAAGTFQSEKFLSITENSDKSYIGGYIFSGNSQAPTLKTIILNDTIEAIGDSMFRYQSNIETINFPKNLVAIGGYAFKDASINNLDLSKCDQLDYIGYYAFAAGGQKYAKINTINLSSCRIIDAMAFNQQSTVSFMAPSNLKYIGASAFESCTSLQSIDLSQTDELSFFAGGSNNRDFKIENNKVILNQINENDYMNRGQFQFCSKLESVKFGTNMKFLPNQIFNNCPSLQKIVIPDTIEGIGYMAFQNTGLTEIKLPANLCQTLYYQDPNDNSKFLNDVTYSDIRNSNKIMGERAFASCPNLKKVDMSACTKMKIYGFASYTMGSGTFSDCKNLETVILPPNLERIESSQFSDCILLQNIDFPNSLQKIGIGVFENCSSLGEINLSNTQLTIIGYKAFYGCTALTVKGAFPNTLETIESYAFNNCKALATLDLSNTQLTKITYASFQDCISLTSVKLPPSLTETEESCFYRDAAITEIDFSNTKLKKIGNQSFLSCSGLKIVKLPDTLIQIDNRAFWNCYNLSQINFPASLSTIQYSAFQECLALKDIDLSTCIDLTEIPENCFRCSSVDNCTYTEDANIKLPDSIITIGNCAFQKRKNIRALNWPVSLETIGNNAFDGTNGIKFLDFSNTKLTAIGENAFWNCNGIQFVWFPKDTQITLKKDAFVYCASLYLDIPDNVSIASDNSFAWGSISYEGTDVNYPWNATNASTKHAGLYNDNNFTPWKELIKNEKIWQSGSTIGTQNDKTIAGDLIIPDNVITINGNTFKNYDNLTSITTGTGLENLYIWDPFSYCDNLKKLDFSRSNKLTIIPQGCSFRNYNMETVLLPNSITTINADAFNDNQKLNIVVPNSVTSIGTNAFYNVKSVTYSGTATGSPWGAKSINNTQTSAASLASVSLSDIPEEEDTILLPPTTVSDGNADVVNDAPIINEEETIKDSVSSGDAETSTSDEIISDNTEDTLSDDDWLQLALSVSDGNAAPGDREKCEEKLTEMQESGITPEISELMKILMQIIISVILPRCRWY